MTLLETDLFRVDVISGLVGGCLCDEEYVGWAPIFLFEDLYGSEVK